MDKINDKYGEFVITPTLMMGMDETILDRIAFGGVKELEELYQQQPLPSWLTGSGWREAANRINSNDCG
jgi:hypothetical protein